MLLEKLSDYANQLEDIPPPMYQPTLVRYVVHLDMQGTYQGSVELTDERGKATIRLLAPHCKRSSGIKPKLLVDNGEYVLGIARDASNPTRIQAQHAAYVALVHDCAATTEEPTVIAIARFLDTPDAAARVLQEQRDFDPSGNISFRVDGIDPCLLEGVKAYWAKKAAAGDSEMTMQCLVCGEMRPPVERLPIVIKGIPGGLSTGMTLISANADAFESYGLSASLIAPTCEDCGERFGNALNDLLRRPQTHFIIAPLAYIFWVRAPTPLAEDLIIPDLMDAQPEMVKALLRSARRGDATATFIDAPAFFAATLSTSGARVVVRDWIETSVDGARRDLARFFWLQHVLDTTGDSHYFSLAALIQATTNRHSKEKPPAAIGEALMHVALHGGRLPLSLMYKVIHRMRATRDVQPAQAALIKMVLLSQQDSKRTDYEGDHTMATLDEENHDIAYLCGRLLAQLDYIQYRAQGKINATIVDRFYGTASTAPAIVFPRLIKGAIPHLATLRASTNTNGFKSYASSFSYPEKELSRLLEHIPAFPAQLTLEQQGLFGLGFFFQKAAYLHPRPATPDESQPSELLTENELSDTESSL